MNSSTEKNIPVWRGIVLVLMAVALFSTMDVTTKYLTRFYPIITILWVRFVFHAIIIFILMYPRIGSRLLRSAYPWTQLARGILLIAASLLFVTGIKYLPIADATAIAFLSPLLVTILAVVFLKEKVTAVQWIAIFASFIGVLIIIRPGSELFSWFSLLPLINAFCFASYQILTRRIAGVENGYTSNFYAGLTGALVLTVVVPFNWVAPKTLFHIGLFLLVGLLGVISHMVIIKAYDYAPASRLAPFSYSQLIWVMVFGYVVFGDFPDFWALVGISIVIASGVFVATRQRRVKIISPTVLPKDESV